MKNCSKNAVARRSAVSTHSDHGKLLGICHATLSPFVVAGGFYDVSMRSSGRRFSAMIFSGEWKARRKMVPRTSRFVWGYIANKAEKSRCVELRRGLDEGSETAGRGEKLLCTTVHVQYSTYLQSLLTNDHDLVSCGRLIKPFRVMNARNSILSVTGPTVGV